jgi:hypothetical protein
MKKNRKIVILIVLVFIVLVAIFFYYVNLSNKNEKEEARININDVVENKINDKKIKIQNISGNKTSVVQSIDSVNIKNIKVSLKVLDKIYNIETKEEASVFDVMKKLKENNSFDFNYTEHLGLGVFVNEINGIKGIPGKYWIYYINDIEASVGISNFILKSGDIISWKQESF